MEPKFPTIEIENFDDKLSVGLIKAYVDSTLSEPSIEEFRLESENLADDDLEGHKEALFCAVRNEMIIKALTDHIEKLENANTNSQG